MLKFIKSFEIVSGNLNRLLLFLTLLSGYVFAQNDKGENPYQNYERNDLLGMPSNVETIYEPTPDGEGFYIYRVINGKKIEPPGYISFEDYVKLHDEKTRRKNFKTFAKRSEVIGANPTEEDNTGLIPPINVNSQLFKDIFGSGKVSIRPNVTVLMDFSVKSNRMKNPNLTLRQQRNTFIDFNQQIQLNVNGQIGEKLKLRVNYDTKAMFDFENQFKVEYAGTEDDIIKKIEAGNVSLPLNGALISGGQNLWGIKTQMQFGPVWFTGVASQQRSKTQEIVIKGGKQQTPFSVKVADYDYNRHFFLSHYFRSIYEKSLQNLPTVTSGINITRIEVWVTNRASASTSNNRNAVGFIDMAENAEQFNGVIFNDNVVNATGRFPDNNSNNLYQLLRSDPAFRDKATAVQSLQNSLNLRNGLDFELVENMRKLAPNEYYVNRQLGFISLNTTLNPNDVLFVAYEYTIAGIDSVFRVGEFSVDQPANQTNTNVLFLKMLKPSAIRPKYNNQPYPTWDLMMKNVYSIGAYNLSKDGFEMQIYYEAMDGSGDINYLPAQDVSNKTLLQLFGVDRLRNNMEIGSDNRFDFVEGVTVIPDKGVIIFPELEPFGEYLVRQFTTNRTEDSAKYAFTPLYDLTPFDAAQYYPQLNRFKFIGSYQSASTGSDIFLNAVQIVNGSVRVTAGGRILQEGTDYTVDYNVGKVTITNPGILNSGQDIRITYETNELFGIQQKTIVGGRFDFKFSKKINLGATMLYGRERPLVNKIFIGEEPVSNVLWGMDFSVKEDSRLITNILNRLPFYSTNTKSSVMLQGEFAHFIPGFPKQINQGGDKKGTAYLDDFEGARYIIDLTNRFAWQLASLPSNLKIPTYADPRYKGFTRAKLAWYGIDPQFFDNPKLFGYSKDSPELNNHYTRRVSPLEVFPNRTTAGANILTTFDLYYLPMKRGPYNYQTDPAKLNPDGTFKFPEENWAGIMRRTTGNTDFEAANFEYIEFWLMDPFLYNQNNSGKLVFNLGKISEDILPDGQRAYENGLPTTEEANNNNQNLTVTAWGRVPTIQAPTTAFDNDPNARQYQDVGLDGLRDEDEVNFFQQFLQDVQNAVTNPEALAELQANPSTDNFRHFTDDVPGKPNPTILDRYEDFNGTEGNSPAQDQDNQTFSRAATTRPDIEDMNGDATLNTIESFWEYTVELDTNKLQVGKNYIVDKREMEVDLPNGSQLTTRWYLFRIPLREGRPVGGIQDFKAIDFIRMYLTGFKDTTILRFGKLQLVSLSWRRYFGRLMEGGEAIPTEPGLPDDTFYELATLNVEENGNKEPFNYVIPPGVQRQNIPGSPITGILQNEQTMVIRVGNLQDGDARAAFKNVNFDLRFFDKMKLFFHLEPLSGWPNPNINDCGDAKAFIRIGTDFVSNYYEYEIDLCPSDFGDQSPENIWKNSIEIILTELSQAKVVRDQQAQIGNASYNKRFEYVSPSGQKIYLIGTPRLDQVKTIMIGIRNPEDDGLPISAEMWFNELRVSDFYLKTGFATTGRANIKLADLGNISLSGFYKTPNFGGLQEKITQRSLEWTKRYNTALSLDLGKLIPNKLKLQIPFYATYGKDIIEPRFNPYNPDILLKQSIELYPQQQRQEKYNEMITYSRTYSYSFNNVRKLRSRKKGKNSKTHLWDIENFSLTYAYARTDKHTPQLEYEILENYKGGFNYNYSFRTKKIQPFKRLGKKPNLISEFNFFLLPKTISYSVMGNRNYRETKLRNIRGGLEIPPVFNQDFRITRNFNMNWALTQSLNVNLRATTVSRVDEPYGKIDTQEKKDSLLNNIFSIGKDPANGKYHKINIGRTLNYNQNLQVNYRLPFRLIKILNWWSASITYSAQYSWQTAALQNKSFGNTITNNRNLQASAQLDFMKFYRKFKFLKEILKPVPKKNVFSKADSTRKEGDEPKVLGQRIYKGIGQFLLGIRNVNISYNVNDGTTLPGFMPRSGLFGLYEYENDSLGVTSLAPGWDFVLGQQPDLRDTTWLTKAKDYGWITNNPLFATPFSQQNSTQLNAQVRMEPFRYFTVNITFNQSQQETYSALYSYDSLTNSYKISNRMLTGNFSTTFFSFPTAFQSIENDKAFQELKESRKIISQRLKERNKNYNNAIPNPTEIDGYWNGYLWSSQDVLIPAFLAAYGPKNANDVDLSPKSNFPYPNWDINFTGLSKIAPFDDWFKNITIRHAYRSSYSVSYTLNLKAKDYNGDGIVDTYEELQQDTTQQVQQQLYNFSPLYVIQSIGFNESFAPLLGITMNFDNGMNVTLDFKKSRMVNLNIGVQQLTESRNTDLSFRFSWRRKGFEQPITLFGKEISLKNNITYRMEMTYRKVRTQNRFLDSDITQPTGGSTNIIIKPSIDYMVNTQLTARVYFEKNINNPVLSTSFPTRFTAFGVQVRFTLSN